MTTSIFQGAIEQISRILAKDLGAKGIRVNTVSPGPTSTALFLEGKSEAMLKGIAGASPFVSLLSFVFLIMEKESSPEKLTLKMLRTASETPGKSLKSYLSWLPRKLAGYLARMCWLMSALNPLDHY